MLSPANGEQLHLVNYVEDYLDSIESLPFDLQRNVSLMREIDAKYQGKRSLCVRVCGAELGEGCLCLSSPRSRGSAVRAPRAAGMAAVCRGAEPQRCLLSRGGTKGPRLLVRSEDSASPCESPAEKAGAGSGACGAQRGALRRRGASEGGFGATEESAARTARERLRHNIEECTVFMMAGLGERGGSWGGGRERAEGG